MVDYSTSRPLRPGQGQVAMLRIITATVAIALVVIAGASWFVLDRQFTGNPVLGCGAAIAAPVVSLALSRVVGLISPPVRTPADLATAYGAQFFMTMAATEAPGILLFALGFIMELSAAQVSLGMVLTAAVVWISLRPTRRRAEEFVRRKLPDGTDAQAFLDQF